MPILTWELWLAKDLVAQHHLPWQKPIQNLTRLSGGTINGFTFARDWYTYGCSQNPWKLSRLEEREQAY